MAFTIEAEKVEGANVSKEQGDKKSWSMVIEGWLCFFFASIGTSLGFTFMIWGPVFYEIALSVFIVWLVLLYIVKNRLLRGFLATVCSVSILFFIDYIKFMDSAGMVPMLIFFQVLLCIGLIGVFEWVRDFLLKKIKKA